jgi:hypothetical protein
MAQRKTPARAPAPAVLDQVGPYVLGTLLRRDRLGELYRGEGPAGPVRVRVCPAQEDPARITAVLDHAAQAAHPAVAPVLDQLVDDAGRVAVVTPVDRLTLAERRKLGRLDTATIGPLGCALLDGLAALHAAGVQHGAVSSNAVGIDEDSAARWQDAGLQPALGHSRMAPELRAAGDVAECAAMLRDLGRLPTALEEVLDPVASGVPGAIERAEPLAAAWRAALARLDLPVPPVGVRARIPGLLAPPAKPARTSRLRRLRRQPPRWARLTAVVLLVAAALAVVPAAALGPGGGPVLDRIDAYAPLHKGTRLVYRLLGAGLDLTVTLHVTESRVIAGDLTATLVGSSSLPSGAPALPLGLSGATLRVRSDSIVRTASGGAVRDLVVPLSPGSTWSDRRSGVISSQLIVETRQVLGPVSIDVPAGHFERCVAVALTSTTRVPGATPTTGTGTLWYCPGVGLARALLSASGQSLGIELVSVH